MSGDGPHRRIAARLYRALGRVMPCDATVVLRLDLDRRPASSVEAAARARADERLSLVLLDEGELRALAAQEPTLRDALPHAGGAGERHVVIARHAGRAVGHAWFARGRVDASLNTGGTRFRGIGLRLPPSVCYVFKVHVAPELRGRGLAAAMIGHGIAHLPGARPASVVTTTDWTNTAFRRTASRLGFERVGRAIELVVGGRHLFRLPPPLGDRPDRTIRLIRGEGAG